MTKVNNIPVNRSRLQGSRTAEIVAVSRARHLIAHQQPYILEDRFAIDFISPFWKTMISNPLLDTLLTKTVFKTLLPITTQHLARARFTEDHLEKAIQNGVEQYIIMGSGYDSYAFRTKHKDVTIFEIDLEASLKLKQNRIQKANLSVPNHLKFIPFDFEKDNLEVALTQRGFKKEKKSFFNWMGVTYYLTIPAILDTVETIASISATGSEICFDYLIAEEFVPPKDKGIFKEMMDYVKKRGEPMITRFNPEKVVTDLSLKKSWKMLNNQSPQATSETYSLLNRTDIPPIAPITWFLHLSKQ